MGDDGSPSSIIRFPGQKPGLKTDERSAAEYGWHALLKKVETGASSTIRPRYITATVEADSFTEGRSWVIIK